MLAARGLCCQCGDRCCDRRERFGCLRVWFVPGTHAADLSEARDCLIFIIGLSCAVALLVIMLRRGCPLHAGIDRRDRGVGGSPPRGGAATLLNFFHPFDAAGTDLRARVSGEPSHRGNSALSGRLLSTIFYARRNALAGLLELGAMG